MSNEQVFDLTARSVRELNQALHDLNGATTGPQFKVLNAQGDHALAVGIDAPLDAWNGTLARLAPSAFDLVAADTAPALRFRYSPAAIPPWMKALWRDPESTGTGR